MASIPLALQEVQQCVGGECPGAGAGAEWASPGSPCLFSPPGLCYSCLSSCLGSLKAERWIRTEEWPRQMGTGSRDGHTEERPEGDREGDTGPGTAPVQDQRGIPMQTQTSACFHPVRHTCVSNHPSAILLRDYIKVTTFNVNQRCPLRSPACGRCGLQCPTPRGNRRAHSLLCVPASLPPSCLFVFPQSLIFTCCKDSCSRGGWGGHPGKGRAVLPSRIFHSLAGRSSLLVCLSAHHGALCTRGEEAGVQSKLGGSGGGHSPDPASLVLSPCWPLGWSA